MTQSVPVCLECRHNRGQVKCSAFPGGIPDVIWRGDNDHRKPYPGDGGIQYERRDDAPADD